jgi:glycosyltransferase involved in cell wall biosynthesis
LREVLTKPAQGRRLINLRTPDLTIPPTPLVAVLMSTYNGEKYLEQQIETILQQKDVTVELFIRDDGSTDSTLQILNSYSKAFTNIHVDFGNNLGLAKSFMQLIRNTETTAQYFALSDQDDIWDERKLLSAIKIVQAEETASPHIPLLYSGSSRVVDSKGQFLRIHNTVNSSCSKYAMAITPVANGHTFLFNQKLQTYLKRHHPKYLLSHDIYILLLACWLGKILFDNNAYVSWRRHENAVSTTGSGGINHVKGLLRALRVRFFGTSVNSVERYCNEIVATFHSEMSDSEKAKIQTLVSYRQSSKNRMTLLLDRDYSRGMPIKSQLVYFFAVVLGRL